MRAVIQRVSSATVEIHGNIFSSCGMGMLIFVGIEEEDGHEDVEWLTARIAKLRIFPDSEGVMNLSIVAAKGEILVVSQFTLHASTKKGNRPSYIRAARPEIAIPLYEAFIESLAKETEIKIRTGEFGAMMQVSLVNDGPVTIWIDSKNRE